MFEKLSIMENILSEINVGNLELKLSSDKLYIKTKTSSETFAMRSINGIGVVDLVEKYNHELSEKRKKRINAFIFLTIGLFMVVLGINFSSVPFALIGMLIVIFGFIMLPDDKPKLISAVRIMMTGGKRDFEFDKGGSGVEKIAEFVAIIESTLSAYYKQNN